MGFRELPVTHAHAMAAGRLPALHHDPFDRMLIAQATTDGLTLVTRDADIHRYDVDVLVARRAAANQLFGRLRHGVGRVSS